MEGETAHAETHGRHIEMGQEVRVGDVLKSHQGNRWKLTEYMIMQRKGIVIRGLKTEFERTFPCWRFGKRAQQRQKQ